MYECSTNLQGPHGIPQFLVALKEALLCALMSPAQRCHLCVMLNFEFLVCILLKENMSKMLV